VGNSRNFTPALVRGPEGLLLGGGDVLVVVRARRRGLDCLHFSRRPPPARRWECALSVTHTHNSWQHGSLSGIASSLTHMHFLFFSLSLSYSLFSFSVSLSLSIALSTSLPLSLSLLLSGCAGERVRVVGSLQDLDVRTEPFCPATLAGQAPGPVGGRPRNTGRGMETLLKDSVPSSGPDSQHYYVRRRRHLHPFCEGVTRSGVECSIRRPWTCIPGTKEKLSEQIKRTRTRAFALTPHVHVPKQ